MIHNLVHADNNLDEFTFSGHLSQTVWNLALGAQRRTDLPDILIFGQRCKNGLHCFDTIANRKRREESEIRQVNKQ